MALLSVAFLSLLALVNSARVLLIGESSEQQLVSLFEEAQSSTFQVSSMVVNHEADEAIQNSTFCAKLASLQISAIIDLSWRGWYMAEQQAKEAGVPYLKVEVIFAKLFSVFLKFSSFRFQMHLLLRPRTTSCT